MWFEELPIAINNSFGDPFQPSQIYNTLTNINSLENYPSPFCICTKDVPSDKIIELLKRTNFGNNFLPFYSLTGLNEGDYSFEERERSINELFDLWGKMIIMVRPIIANRNDDI